ncbi:hypothetical protein CXB51_022744 [Gossypium anomalum]|uniref:Acylamino-acid-releasing enzyme N-terminal domain-containing protein n=1 Tax=Gossypium anomalum TaxID=47600 RepID=A0A8J5YFI3_9ROSI|nr:hypothetical protein CXB51_022744 [Gossypium anomalum]
MWLEIICGIIIYQLFRRFFYGGNDVLDVETSDFNAIFSVANRKNLPAILAMDSSKAGTVKELPVGLDEATEEEYASHIDKAWVFKSESGIGSQAMFSISQPNLLANKKRKFMLSTSISKESNNNVNFQWAPFPVEMTGVSITVPSPSGSKLLVIRNPENESPTQFEIWSSSRLEKEFRIPQSTHGSVYADGWFWGISWNSDESLIAYVAEEPSPCKPSSGVDELEKQLAPLRNP